MYRTGRKVKRHRTSARPRPAVGECGNGAESPSRVVWQRLTARTARPIVA